MTSRLLPAAVLALVGCTWVPDESTAFDSGKGSDPTTNSAGPEDEGSTGGPQDGGSGSTSGANPAGSDASSGGVGHQGGSSGGASSGSTGGGAGSTGDPDGAGTGASSGGAPGAQPQEGPWSACLLGADCGEGMGCLNNGPTPTDGFCTQVCVGFADPSGCAPSPGGDAVVSCVILGGQNICALDCAGGKSCPQGMVCVQETVDAGVIDICM